MRYIVFSDSHGRKSYMEKACDKERFDGIIHLGDGCNDLDDIENYYSNKSVIHLAGNCDLGSQYPNEQIAVTDGVTFLCTHGNKYNVKYGYDNLAYHCSTMNIPVVLFGHSHTQLLKEDYHGIFLLNPGTVKLGDYAVIEFKDGKVKAELKSIDD